jgi:DNA-binding CsgD family transcriptional regulator
MPEYLMQALEVLVPADIGLIVVYGEKIKPVNIYDNAVGAQRSLHIDAYFEGAYLLDPYYRAGIDGIKSGVYRLSDVAPSGFRQSEYYKRYYQPSQSMDEVGFITHLPDGCFANTSLVNTVGSPKFNRRNTENLKSCQPIVDEALAKYWMAKKERNEQDGSQLHSQLESALGVFATSVLTSREGEVIKLYLHGHNTRSIAERLGISNHTVSLHRKNSYAKLDITSQAELFHLFIDSLSCIDSELKHDPLKTYLNPGPKLHQGDAV